MTRLAAALGLAAVLVGAGCTTDPSYLEAYGSFGSGESISFKEPATLTVGADATSGATPSRSSAASIRTR